LVINHLLVSYDMVKIHRYGKNHAFIPSWAWEFLVWKIFLQLAV